jgi:hypothetical protein
MAVSEPPFDLLLMVFSLLIKTYLIEKLAANFFRMWQPGFTRQVPESNRQRQCQEWIIRF